MWPNTACGTLRSALCAAMFLGGGVGTAAAQAETEPDAVVESVSWETDPGELVTPDTYPTLAFILGVTGRVQLLCTARVDGSVADCQVISSTTPGWGFEDAAVRLIESGRVRPGTVNGVAEARLFSTGVPFLTDTTFLTEPYQGIEPTPEDLAVVRDYVAFVARAEDLVCVDINSLTPQERVALMPVLRQAFEEHRGEWVSAMALGLARSLPPGLAQARRRGQPLALPTGEGEWATFDQLTAVETRIFARARVLYCAQYDCPGI